MITIGGAWTKRALLQPPNAVSAHQARHPMSPAGMVAAFEFPGHPRTAITTPGFLVNLDNHRPKLLIAQLPAAGLALEPRIVATARKPQDLTDPRRWKFHRQRFHLGISFCGGSSESMPRDFFRMSRWVLTRSNSRRSRWFSMRSC